MNLDGKRLQDYVGEDFTFINHNKTDYDSYKDFQEHIETRFKDVSKERSIEVRKQRLEIWDENTPQRWKGASLAKVDKEISSSIQKMMKSDLSGSYYVYGDPGAGKTYAAYAIMRKLVGVGKLAPSQIKIVSEESILGYAISGFEGRAQFDKLVSGKYKGFIFDNVASKDIYEPKREIPLIEHFLQYVYSNSIPVVFTSNVKPSGYSYILNENGQSKMRALIEGRVIKLNPKKTNNLGSKSQSSASVLDHFDN